MASQDDSRTAWPSVAVVVPTVDRPESLRRMYEALLRQTLPPSIVVLSVPDASGIPADISQDPLVKVVTGSRGCPAQRNAGVATLTPDVDYVVFFDDDAVPADDYLMHGAEFLSTHADVVGLTGHVLRDGAREKSPIPAAEISAALRGLASSSPPDGAWTPTTDLYGCNMMVRYGPLLSTMFDGDLPLYGWLEDLDFSRRLMRLGTLARVEGCRIVHEGSSSGGRLQHRRFGYSVISNPVHLVRKGSIGWKDVTRLIAVPTAANILGLLSKETRGWRRQRLVGSFLAVVDLARGRCHPRGIISLS